VINKLSEIIIFVTVKQGNNIIAYKTVYYKRDEHHLTVIIVTFLEADEMEVSPAQLIVT
jgi:hypothetical protein